MNYDGIMMDTTHSGFDAITVDAVRVDCVSVQHGCADHAHDVGCTDGDRHPVLTQPLTEVLCLASKLLQLVFVLKGRGVTDKRRGAFKDVKQCISL